MKILVSASRDGPLEGATHRLRNRRDTGGGTGAGRYSCASHHRPIAMANKLQLLLVEDNAADAELIARHLARGRIDCAIHRVQTEADLVSALKTLELDLIISDFSLPQFDGLRALEIAIARAPDVPFIFVSGTIGEERAIEAVRRGATDYVLKTNMARLSSAVERALRESEIKANQRHSEKQRREQDVRLERRTRSYRMLSNTSSKDPASAHLLNCSSR